MRIVATQQRLKVCLLANEVLGILLYSVYSTRFLAPVDNTERTIKYGPRAPSGRYRVAVLIILTPTLL